MVGLKLFKKQVSFKKYKFFFPGNQSCFILHLKTQAGTYVKEFVHGDFGRTKPSISDLLQKEVDILALDVTSIDLDWPKPINYDNVV